MTVQLKRAYAPPDPADGKRFLVDRLWPRGLRRDALLLTGWLKDLAPSTELRRWYNHVPERWEEFRTRYRSELLSPERQADLAYLADESAHGQITLVFGTRDTERNEAVVLKEVLEDSRDH